MDAEVNKAGSLLPPVIARRGKAGRGGATKQSHKRQTVMITFIACCLPFVRLLRPWLFTGPSGPRNDGDEDPIALFRCSSQ
jgi:hypothetical protein